METNGKALVITEVLKQELLFKAVHISDATHLPRQNVHYHLDKLVSLGLLEKQGSQYAVTDRNKLLDELMNAHDSMQVKRGESTKLYNFKELRQIVDVVLLLRAMGLVESFELKTHMADLMKRTAESLMAERKYLLNKQTSPGSARKQLRKDINYEDEFIKFISDEFEEKFGYEWTTPMKKRIDEFIDRMNEED